MCMEARIFIRAQALLVGLVSLFSVAAFSKTSTQVVTQSGDSHYCQKVFDQCSYYEAAPFSPWQEIPEYKRNLLQGFLFSSSNPSDIPQLYQLWATTHNSEAAAYLAVTHALDQL